MPVSLSFVCSYTSLFVEKYLINMQKTHHYAKPSEVSKLLFLIVEPGKVVKKFDTNIKIIIRKFLILF